MNGLFEINKTHFTNDISSSVLPSKTNFLSKYRLELPSAIAALTESNHMAFLGQSYQPGMYDVVCGRGKGSYNCPGNKRFRSLIVTFIPRYLKARSKIDKSLVLNSIIDELRSYIDPDTGSSAQFVKHTKSNGWVLIGDEHAREKLGHAMREAIATQQGKSKGERKPTSPSPSPKPTQEIQMATSLYNPCGDEIFTLPQQNLLIHHLRRTVHQRSSLTSLDMQAAVDALLAGI